LYAKQRSNPFAPGQPALPRNWSTQNWSIEMGFWIGVPFTGTLRWTSRKNVRNVAAPPLRTQFASPDWTPAMLMSSFETDQ
jgi:hypothetical protein